MPTVVLFHEKAHEEPISKLNQVLTARPAQAMNQRTAKPLAAASSSGMLRARLGWRYLERTFTHSRAPVGCAVGLLFRKEVVPSGSIGSARHDPFGGRQHCHTRSRRSLPFGCGADPNVIEWGLRMMRV